MAADIIDEMTKMIVKFFGWIIGAMIDIAAWILKKAFQLIGYFLEFLWQEISRFAKSQKVQKNFDNDSSNASPSSISEKEGRNEN